MPTKHIMRKLKNQSKFKPVGEINKLNVNAKNALSVSAAFLTSYSSSLVWSTAHLPFLWLFVLSQRGTPDHSIVLSLFLTFTSAENLFHIVVMFLWAFSGYVKQKVLLLQRPVQKSVDVRGRCVENYSELYGRICWSPRVFKSVRLYIEIAEALTKSVQKCNLQIKN